MTAIPLALPFDRRRRVRARLGPVVPRRAPALERIGVLLARTPSFRGRNHVELGRCGVAAIFGALALLTRTHGARALAALPLGAIGGWHAGRLSASRAASRRATEMRRALPHAIDRLSTCVLAGMSVERSLRIVAPGTPGALGAAFATGLRALDAGVPRARAYELIAREAGVDEVRSLLGALARAERFGTSVSAALLAGAREVRAYARAAAEAEARAAPVKMIFPLVFCFLPAFVLLVIGPIAISAVRSLRSI